MIARCRSRAIVSLRAALRTIYSQRLRRYPRLRTLLDRHAGTASAAVDLADAIALYEAVGQRRPRCLLELGPGTSTNVIALALDEMHDRDPTYTPDFLSVEENPRWLQEHERIFEPALRGQVTLVQRDTSSRDGAAYYVDVPRRAYDFVFVDGPDHLRLGCDWTRDVLDLADVLAPTCTVIFDGRERSARETWAGLEPLGFARSRHPFSLCWVLTRG